MALRNAVLAVMAATNLAAAPALAQITDDPLDRPSQQRSGVAAVAFLRFTLAGPEQSAEAPSFGLGFYQREGMNFTARGFEFAAPLTFDGPLMLRTTGLGGRHDVLGWPPETGIFGIDGDGAAQPVDTGWVWIALGVAAGVGVAAALSQDSDPLMCTGNTVPDPINNTCVPLVIG